MKFWQVCLETRDSTTSMVIGFEPLIRVLWLTVENF